MHERRPRHRTDAGPDATENRGDAEGPERGRWPDHDARAHSKTNPSGTASATFRPEDGAHLRCQKVTLLPINHQPQRRQRKTVDQTTDFQPVAIDDDHHLANGELPC